MQIGDRVRDKGTKFVGTIVQLDPPTGIATRARFQADDVKQDRVIGDPPPESMWQKLDEIELVDRDGAPISGKSIGTLDTGGTKLGESGGNGKKAAAETRASRA